jgi:hypothetical protein
MGAEKTNGRWRIENEFTIFDPQFSIFNGVSLREKQ